MLAPLGMEIVQLAGVVAGQNQSTHEQTAKRSRTRADRTAMTPSTPRNIESTLISDAIASTLD
jgi:hypothetical protein